MSDTVAESLKSILKNCPDHYEIVIVDESDDGSREIIDGLDIKNPVNKIYEDGLGLSRSRNLVVEEASNEIVITHVDMDDWYDSRYFEPLVELYSRIREARGGDDFFFSCPNFNITGKETYLEKYKLRDLPIGVGERDYRWRVINHGDLIWLKLDKNVSRRIKLSERKTIVSRIKRSYLLIRGLFQIGYSVRRVVKEEVVRENFSWYSSLFKLILVPIAYIASRFRDSVDTNIPKDGESMREKIDQNTYTVQELQQKYGISQDMKINTLIDTE